MAEAVPTISMSPESFLGLGTFFVVLAGIFVIARIVVNLHKTKKFLVEDGIAIFALVFLAATFGLIYKAAIALTDPTITLYWMLQMAVAVNFISGIAMWSSKVPILLLFVRLFGVNGWIRITSYILIFTTFVIFLAGMSVVGAQCTPKPNTTYQDPTVLLNCTNRASQVGVTLASVAVLVDVIILALPLPVLSQLRLPYHQKIGLFVVFLTGVFAIATSAVSLYFKTLSFTGKAADMTSAMICTVIECSIAIIVGCVPSTYAFWSNYVAGSPIYSKIRSGFSSLSGSAKSWARPTQNSVSVGGKAGDNGSQQQIYVTSEFGSREYYKMNSRDRIPPLPTTTETVVTKN